MLLDNVTKFQNALKMVGESEKFQKRARNMRRKAEKVEDDANELLKNAREEMMKGLQDDLEELEEKYKNLDSEYESLFSTFCKQRGGHFFKYTKIITNTSIRHDCHYFGRGYEPHYKIYEKCLICGFSNDPFARVHFRDLEKANNVILEAAKQTENLELQKTAKRILKISKELEIITKKREEISKMFEEVCSICGHELVRDPADWGVPICRCCGKKFRNIEN